MSESIEMYLVTLARMSEAGVQAPFPHSALANSLKVLPVSANQMIHKLKEDGLVDFTPYKGVQLTPSGEKQAWQVLRRHRLWEVFLVEQLNIPLDQADSLADRMEHLLPVEAAERLAEFLGNPTASPTGKPIPPAGDKTALIQGVTLRSLHAGQSGAVSQITASAALRQFLASQKVTAGTKVTVLAVGNDGNVLLETTPGAHLHLSTQAAEMIWVNPI